MKIFVGASPTPRCSRAGRSAAGKLLPRKCPERSLVPTKIIGSRCMNPRLPPDRFPVLAEVRSRAVVPVGVPLRTRLAHVHHGLHPPHVLPVHGFHGMPHHPSLR